MKYHNALLLNRHITDQIFHWSVDIVLVLVCYRAYAEFLDIHQIQSSQHCDACQLCWIAAVMLVVTGTIKLNRLLCKTSLRRPQLDNNIHIIKLP